jgi:hypothetical protein
MPPALVDEMPVDQDRANAVEFLQGIQQGSPLTDRNGDSHRSGRLYTVLDR